MTSRHVWPGFALVVVAARDDRRMRRRLACHVTTLTPDYTHLWRS